MESPEIEPTPPEESKRIARNQLVGRIMILVFGALVIIQVAPMLIRVFRHLPL